MNVDRQTTSSAALSTTNFFPNIHAFRPFRPHCRWQTLVRTNARVRLEYRRPRHAQDNSSVYGPTHAVFD